jgi:thioredoxin-related protein
MTFRALAIPAAALLFLLAGALAPARAQTPATESPATQAPDAAGSPAAQQAPAAEGGAAALKSEPELKWHSFDEGMRLAAETKKVVLVDVYTSWCGWCKRMELTTYKDAKVIQDLNDHFVLVKLNAESARPLTYKEEKTTEQRLSHEVFGVTGYPTTVFLRADGEIITPVSGYLAADRFHLVLTFIGTGAYESTKWADYLKKNS